MNPGTLRHRVTFKRIVRTVDAAGGKVVSYGATLARMCRVTPVSGSETESTFQQMNKVRWTIKARWDSELAAVEGEHWDAFHNNKKLDILEVLPRPEIRLITIVCEEKQ